MRLALVAPFCLLVTASPLIHADTFSVNATFFAYSTGCTPFNPAACATGSLTGTETINTATGYVTGASLVALLNGSSYTFSGAPSYQLADPNSAEPNDPNETPQAYVQRFYSGSNELELNLSIHGSLDAYKGGIVCGITTPCSGGNSSYAGFLNGTSLNTGTVTPVVTPEPSSFALLGTGLLGVAGTLKRRFA